MQSGIGVKIQNEGRDNRLNAKKGFYVDASYQVFRKALGSEFNFEYFQTDIRYYNTPYKKITIASQIRTEAKNGDVPVQSLSQLGGDFAMRGTYRGRYRDLVAVDTQLELRFPIFWIFGGTIFNSLGQVAPSYKDLSFNAFHYNYGFGLRLKVDSVHDINLRFDYGISKDQTYFIVNFAEAF
jgi:outer membrane protein assembly factor BamA